MPRGVRPPNAGKGRKKGVPNKYTAAIKDMLRQALEGAGGVQYLIEQARENPGPFLSLIGKLIPHEVSATLAGKVSLAQLVEQSMAQSVAQSVVQADTQADTEAP